MWFFQHAKDNVLVLSLADASTLARPARSTTVMRACRLCLKDGDRRLLGVIGGYLLSAIRATPELSGIEVWSSYPGAQATNVSLEALTSFPQTLMKTVDRGPLLIRHQPALQRHLSAQGRYDPLPQLATLHVNPAYRLQGKAVGVLDDYLTYGVCAASTIALLHAAGASRVACISIGKFGDVTCSYDVEVQGDPQQPGIRSRCHGRMPLSGRYDRVAQGAFCAILSRYL